MSQSSIVSSLAVQSFLTLKDRLTPKERMNLAYRLLRGVNGAVCWECTACGMFEEYTPDAICQCSKCEEILCDRCLLLPCERGHILEARYHGW